MEPIQPAADKRVVRVRVGDVKGTQGAQGGPVILDELNAQALDLTTPTPTPKTKRTRRKKAEPVVVEDLTPRCSTCKAELTPRDYSYGAMKHGECKRCHGRTEKKALAGTFHPFAQVAMVEGKLTPLPPQPTRARRRGFMRQARRDARKQQRAS